MTEPIEDTQAWNPEERDVEEEDESGAPEKVAWPKTDEAHPLESADELREPPYERGEDVIESGAITGGTLADDH